ncbi:MAG: hypothetical protein AABX29_00275 [Nanoarchaeota archaeon]
MSSPNDTTDYIAQAISNIQTVIQNYKDYLGYKNLEISEDNYIPVYPTITIEFASMTSEWKSMPKRMVLNMLFDITYFSSNLNDRNARQSLRSGLSKLSNCLRENWDLNNYCEDLGTEILSVTPYVLAQGNEVVLGGVISVECRKVISVTLT